MFPWLSVAFVGGFRAGVGQCHPVFQADVTSTIEWEEGDTERYGGGRGGGGGVVVIICAYEEGGSSLVASSRQLLWSSCLWGEVAETRVCSPETRGKVAPQGIQRHSLFTHHKCKSLLKMELEEMITRLAI